MTSPPPSLAPIPSSPLAMARDWLRMGDGPRAAELCRHLLVDRPGDGDALLVLGMAVLGDGRAAEAAALFGRAATLRPGHVQAHANRAAALHRLDRMAEALAACRLALALEPAEPTLNHNLATVRRDLGDEAGTITAFRRLVRLEPHHGAGFHGLTDALRRSGELSEAVAAARALAALHPAVPSTHGNLGILLQFQGRVGAAMRCYARALALDPGYAEARSNLGLAQLLTGDLAAGWVHYASRWEAVNNDDAAVAARLRSALPAWDGGPLDSPLGGRRLLAWGELGVGDEILLAGMIPDLTARGVACVLEAAPRLVPLFARSFPAVEVVPRPAPSQPPVLPPGLAAQCSLGNLGRWLRPDLAAFPRRPRYLTADPERTAVLRERYRAMAGGNRLIGISWHSANPLHRDFKSAPLALWAPVLRLPGITFVDLQYGDRSAELEAVRRAQGVSIIHDGAIDPLSDLDGFAAQVAALDLVISISNTTVHVAGALGVPVWTLLARQTGFLWCWFTEREDSPWYPSMRLYRQAEAGDWSPVFERVRRDLA